MKIKMVFFIFCLWPVLSVAQESWQSPIKLVNTGKMYVDSISSNSGMYIKGGVLMRDSCSIIQNGTSVITGDFVHDASSHVFKTDANGFGSGKGKIVFSGSANSGIRYISTDSLNRTFNRAEKYIAFPHLVIETNDEIDLPTRMGMDALSIKRTSGYDGKIRLASESFTSNGELYDYGVSLRITSSGSSSKLVDAGAVIVERDLGPYLDSLAVGVNTPVFGFATPFNNTQITGYFAGNWVSSIDDLNPDTKTSYVSNLDDVFVPGVANYVRIRDKSMKYEDALQNGALKKVTGQNINKTLAKLDFDGQIYQYASMQEQMFADDLISKNFSTTETQKVYGNSYTSSISISKLASALQSSSANFDGKIYLFPAGSTSFVGYNYANPSLNPSSVSGLTEIPSMNIFMLKASPAGTSAFAITKEMLTHGLTSTNMTKNVLSRSLKSTGTVSDQAEFMVTLASNKNIYDLASITAYDVASNATDSYDGVKQGYDVFGLYTLSSDQTRMSANVVHDVNTPVHMDFHVKTVSTNFILKLSSFKQVNAEGLWLEDKLNGTLTQLAEGEQYAFTATPNDSESRFVVHFYKSTLGVESDNQANITIRYKDNLLKVMNLMDADVNSKLSVLDMQGRMLLQTTITDTPTQSIDVVNLTPGVYIGRVDGKRNATVKFIKD